MTTYADTSFLVSLYTVDTHTARALELIKANPPIWFTPLHHAECSHAIALQVFYSRITETDAHRVHSQLRSDVSSGMWVESAIPEHAFELCADLARRYGAKLGVRTLDSLHVACALELKAERFWTFDERQAKLARAEGLKTNG